MYKSNKSYQGKPCVKKIYRQKHIILSTLLTGYG